jgi:hypothetical protein
MSLPGVTPADPADTGEADPDLLAALAADDRGRVLALLGGARLLVPVVAMPAPGEAGAEAEMAVPTLVNAAGRRALPVFTSLAALAEWRCDARPVPMPGARVVAAAVAEGYDGLVVDVAGPSSFTLDPDDLVLLLA